MFKQFDLVRLKEPDHETGVKTEYTGTIVDVLSAEAMTVEFTDEHGDTVEPALFKTYSTEQLVKAD